MANEKLGRKVSISIDGVVVANARTKSLTINNSPINVTSDGDDGIQRMLSEAGEKAVEVTVEGLSFGATLMDIALSADQVQTIVFNFGTYTVTGDFFQSSYSESMPYNEAMTFSASYSSTGAVVKGA
jgi:predicted secreted protein